MEQDSIMIGIFRRTPALRVFDFLLDNNIFDYTKTDIAKGAGITRPTLYKIWDKFIKWGLVVKTRKINRTQLYKINLQSPIVKKVMEIEMKVSLQEIEPKRNNIMKPVAARL